MRLLIVLVVALRLKLIEWKFNRETLLEHLRYAGPLGLSTIVQRLSRDVAKLFVSIVLGPLALAYYAIGGYLSPFVQTFRVSISDVIFPELTKKKGTIESAARLWRRATVMYSVVMFPIFAVVVIHAQGIVVTLFTEEYLAAVPIFQIYAIYLLRRCFAFDVLLRREGRTDLVLAGSLIGLLINVGLLYPSYKLFGLAGPAITVIATEVVTEIFFAVKTIRLYKATLRKMLDFESIVKVFFASILFLPVLLLASWYGSGGVVSIAGSSIAYCVLVLGGAALMGVDDVLVVKDYVFQMFRRENRRC
jgi:O-antigen/teichoic acid export membrane protein